MIRKPDRNLWCYRRAPGAHRFQKVILATLMVAGGISVAHLFDWWFRQEHVVSLPLFILLSIIFWWGVLRMVILWISYLLIKVPVTPPAPEGLQVAIFTTSSPGEPLSMFEKTLAACANITYPHTTYLLDDTCDPRFKEVAEQYGAVWLNLTGLPGAKAGKINAALRLTTEDFVLVLDPDHIPFPNFLDEVLGYFGDEKVGYVQVAQAYYNQFRSFTAAAAAEQTYGFYGPTQMGMHGINSAVAIGANCTFRRKALDSIGGHGIGLAEDLVTAIRIHSEGWKSVYAPIIVSRGLVPEDLGSFCKQQLKWSRGVHEVLFAELPRLWGKLTFWQKVSYSSIGTYYFSGVTTLLFLLFPYLFIWFGWLPANMSFMQFVVNWLPVALTAMTIYLFVQQWLCHPAHERGLHWRGMFLKFACWPVFFVGFLISFWNGKIPYIPTAKQAVKGFTPFARPLLIHLAIFVSTLIFVGLKRVFYTHEARLELTSGEIWGMVVFAFIAFIMSLGGLYAAHQSRTLKAEEPWAGIDLKKITTTAGNIPSTNIYPGISGIE
ncbi:glycosyltransferase [Segetibacter sp. 3557_3]|uniref:glycosyltransferase family 2 protein n=1 Tax=Segetibacter sp. 3557_3 TaxID=2547429 RepID=UPI0010589C18|nr:cellulose synthase catalytic subunit [Segetibacter sp. 3557_3]TDH19742.1 glycosyltransferase [Segetibacter sp. 3557_3]